MTISGHFDSDQHTPPMTASVAIGKHLRVKVATGQLALAGAGDKAIGTALRDIAQDEQGPVRGVQAPSAVCIADGAIAIGDDVSSAANGQVTSGAVNKIGVAYTAATNAGDVVTVFYDG